MPTSGGVSQPITPMDFSIDFVLRGSVVRSGQVGECTVRAVFAGGPQDQDRVEKALGTAGGHYGLQTQLRRASVKVFADRDLWGTTMNALPRARSLARVLWPGKVVVGCAYAFSSEDGRWKLTAEPPIQLKRGGKLGEYSCYLKLDHRTARFVFAREHELSVPAWCQLDMGDVTGEVVRIVTRAELSGGRILKWLRPEQPVLLPLGVMLLLAVLVMWWGGWRIPVVGSHATAAAIAGGICGCGAARLAAKHQNTTAAWGVACATFGLLSLRFGWLPVVNTHHAPLLIGVLLLLFGLAPAVLIVLCAILGAATLGIALFLALTAGLAGVPAAFWIAAGASFGGSILSLARFAWLRRRGGAFRKP